MNSVRLDAFSRAVDRLGEVLELPVSDVVRDACMQRFEFCFELGWKAIQQAARDQGRDCVSPRSCLREAFAMTWVVDEDAWLAMLVDRNLTSHTYDEELAQAVYSRLPAHLISLKNLRQTLVQEKA